MSDTITIKFDSLADKGMAMGRHEGRVIFAPFAAPGDTCAVRLTKEKRSYAQGEVTEIMETSPDRVAPPCPHFGECGGCSWQHLEYGAQLTGKHLNFMGLCTTRLDVEEETFDTPVSSPLHYGYRNRVALGVEARGDKLVVGFRMARSRRLMSIKHCPILAAPLNEAIAALEETLAPLAAPCSKAALSKIKLQLDDAGTLWPTFEFKGKAPRGLKAKLASLCKELGLAAPGFRSGKSHRLTSAGGESLSRVMMSFNVGPFTEGSLDSDQSDHLRLGVPLGGFVQANSAVNAELAQLIWSQRTHYKGKRTLDLYCGAGNFTLPLALKAAEVAAVELSTQSARAVAYNIGENGLENVEAFAGDAAEVCEALMTDGFAPSYCLLDPPRAGAAEIMSSINAMAPEHIAYVSCAPTTLVRDLHTLKTMGYSIDSLRIADLFPQTSHSEALALLSRR